MLLRGGGAKRGEGRRRGASTGRRDNVSTGVEKRLEELWSGDSDPPRDQDDIEQFQVDRNSDAKGGGKPGSRRRGATVSRAAGCRAQGLSVSSGLRPALRRVLCSALSLAPGRPGKSQPLHEPLPQRRVSGRVVPSLSSSHSLPLTASATAPSTPTPTHHTPSPASTPLKTSLELTMVSAKLLALSLLAVVPSTLAVFSQGSLDPTRDYAIRASQHFCHLRAVGTGGRPGGTGTNS